MTPGPPALVRKATALWAEGFGWGRGCCHFQTFNGWEGSALEGSHPIPPSLTKCGALAEGVDTERILDARELPLEPPANPGLSNTSHWTPCPSQLHLFFSVPAMAGRAAPYLHSISPSVQEPHSFRPPPWGRISTVNYLTQLVLPPGSPTHLLWPLVQTLPPNPHCVSCRNPAPRPGGLLYLSRRGPRATDYPSSDPVWESCPSGFHPHPTQILGQVKGRMRYPWSLRAALSFPWPGAAPPDSLPH